jgi:hypothetical protein
MGNNSFLPVMGRGMVINSLNGQRALIQHACFFSTPRTLSSWMNTVLSPI